MIMYTVYDFINNEIPSKDMRMGWKVEITDSGMISLNYTVLNFDWKSLEMLGGEVFDLFLNSKSYANMKERIENSKRRFHGKTYYECVSISGLKEVLEEDGIPINVDRIVESARKKLSARVKEGIRWKEHVRKTKEREQREYEKLFYGGVKYSRKKRKPKQ